MSNPHAPYATVRLGNRTFRCKVARSPREQAVGLQDTPQLGPDEGMLFPFEPARAATFHMGKVAYPIDIVFVAPGPVQRVATVLTWHASKFDALTNADDKLLFVRACAYAVLDQWDAPEVVVQYLLTAADARDAHDAAMAATAGGPRANSTHGAWASQAAAWAARAAQADMADTTTAAMTANAAIKAGMSPTLPVALICTIKAAQIYNVPKLLQTSADVEAGLQATEQVWKAEGINPAEIVYEAAHIGAPLNTEGLSVTLDQLLEKGRGKQGARASWVAAKVVHNAMPGSAERWSYPKAAAVLELPGGTVAALRAGKQGAYPSPSIIDPDYYEISFPEDGPGDWPGRHPLERYQHSTTPDVGDPNANEMANDHWEQDIGYSQLDPANREHEGPALRQGRVAALTQEQLDEREEYATVFIDALLERGWQQTWRTAGGAVLKHTDWPQLEVRVGWGTALSTVIGVSVYVANTGSQRPVTVMGKTHWRIQTVPGDFEDAIARLSAPPTPGPKQGQTEQLPTTSEEVAEVFKDALLERGWEYGSDYPDVLEHPATDLHARVSIPAQLTYHQEHATILVNVVWEGPLRSVNEMFEYVSPDQLPQALEWIDHIVELYLRQGRVKQSQATLPTTSEEVAEVFKDALLERGWEYARNDILKHETGLHATVRDPLYQDVNIAAVWVSVFWPGGASEFSQYTKPDKIMEVLAEIDRLVAMVEAAYPKGVKQGQAQAEPADPQPDPTEPVVGDPSKYVVGVIEALARTKPMVWRKDVLNSDMTYATLTQDDLRTALDSIGADDWAKQVVTSRQGLQILGDGLVLAGLARAAVVAQDDNNQDLILLTRETEPDQPGGQTEP